MNQHFLVCNYSEQLFSRLSHYSLVIKSENFDDILKVKESSKLFDFHIHCLWIQSELPLSSIPFGENWKGVPIALYVPKLGHFFKFIKLLPLLRELNLRVYLPEDTKENFSSFRILSSLGIESAVIFKEEEQNWEQICDLMTYALLGLQPHAPIAPFNYMAARYDPCKLKNWQTIYFNDPSEYLHLDNKGRVALSQENISTGKFVSEDINEIENIEQCSEYVKNVEKWRNFFLKTDGCAYCEGWRVCLGKFYNASSEANGCKSFFIEFMNTIEQNLTLSEKKNGKSEIWQP